MNFGRISLPFVLRILCSCVCFHIVKAEENCYRGDQYEYQNPCSDDPSNKLAYCSAGKKLNKSCTEECIYCESGTYQDAQYHNCTTCKPCITADDCAEGQEIIEICTSDRNAKCGCPPCPKCVTCPSVAPCECSPCTPCRPCTPCSEQTIEWPLSTIPTVASEPLVQLKFASCHQCCIPLIVISVLFVVAVFAVIILGRCLHVYKTSAGYEVIQGDARVDRMEMGNQTDMRTQQGRAGDDDQKGPSHCMAPLAAEEGDFQDGGQSGSNTHSKDAAEEGTRSTEAFDEHEEEDPLLEDTSDDKKLAKLQEDLVKKKENDDLSPSLQEEKYKNEELKKKVTDLEESQNKLQKETQEKGARIQEVEGQLSEKDKIVAKLQEDLKKMSQTLSPQDVPYSTLPRTKRQDSTQGADSMQLAFLFLSKRLTNWEAVGTRLGLSPGTLYRIQQENINSVQNAVYRMLETWKQQRAHKATYSVLIEALLKEDRRDLAEDLQNREDLK